MTRDELLRMPQCPPCERCGARADNIIYGFGCDQCRGDSLMREVDAVLYRVADIQVRQERMLAVAYLQNHKLMPAGIAAAQIADGRHAERGDAKREHES